MLGIPECVYRMYFSLHISATYILVCMSYLLEISFINNIWYGIEKHLLRKSKLEDNKDSEKQNDHKQSNESAFFVKIHC